MSAKGKKSCRTPSDYSCYNIAAKTKKLLDVLPFLYWGRLEKEGPYFLFLRKIYSRLQIILRLAL